MAKLFLVPGGKVTVSAPLWSVHSSVKQFLWTYTPHNYGGWGISQYIDAEEVQEISQQAANLFALVAESKLRVQLEVPA